ncbi:undecaprenyl-diphosphatase UppP [Caldalkalibacillus mannanilyticus]|uniref:undecaprenyl-diphosphatase UppP n=1 Tax=Caldalkalibacillus mannanilyticus TaxID=1418 RepID=UPI00046859F3|nr:undecaprenyl-diphosphatase UppP [Caldalkalibacillus mannanilyticus]
MSIIEALILGIVQGITEFLPISSTAHIIITSMLFDLTFEGYAFEILLHLGSVLAVMIYFRKDLIELIKGFFGYFTNKSPENKVHFRFSIYIIVATIITGVLGVLLKDYFTESLKTPPVIALSLTMTGLFLIFIERFHKYGNTNESTMGLKETILVGLGQAVAIFPGISRSGSTLVAALWSGLNKETAVRFSFLLSIPVILGSTLLELRGESLEALTTHGIVPLLVSFIASFIFSILGIIWLIDFLKKSKLIYFAIYCFILAAFVYFYLDPNTIMAFE